MAVFANWQRPHLWILLSRVLSQTPPTFRPAIPWRGRAATESNSHKKAQEAQKFQSMMATKNTLRVCEWPDKFLHPCESLPRAYRHLDASIVKPLADSWSRTEFSCFLWLKRFGFFVPFAPLCGYFFFRLRLCRAGTTACRQTCARFSTAR